MEMDYTTAWATLTDALWELAESHPVVAPALGFWAWDMSHDTSAFSLRPRIRGRIGLRTMVQSARRLRKTISESLVSDGQIADLLMVPVDDSDNYLEACKVVAETLAQDNPACRIAWLAPNNLRDKESGWTSAICEVPCRFHVQRTPNLLAHGKARRLLSKVLHKLRHEPGIASWFVEDYSSRQSELAFCIQNFSCARHELQRLGCRAVVTANEKWGSGAFMAAAAAELGIPCHQILHGIPTRVYWPFLSKTTWVWNDATRDAMCAFGAPKNRLVVIGNLEIAAQCRSTDSVAADTAPKHELRSSDGREFKRCLFFSQWSGDRIWKAPSFRAAVDWLGKALASCSTSWRLTVRLHPQDPTDTRAAIADRLEFLRDRLEFSDKSVPLIEDVRRADFACTASSSAILSCVVRGIPSALLWAPDLENIHGGPFLNPKQVARSVEQLIQMMEQSSGTESVHLLSWKDAGKIASKFLLEQLR